MKRFQSILASVDTRYVEHPALQWAARLAEHNRAQLKIIDVVPDLPWLAKLALPDGDDAQQALTEKKSQMLAALAEPIRDGGVEVETQVLSGKSSFAIIHEVLRSGHDLVVRVTKGAHSGRTGFFGTTSMRLLRQCPCAVWLVRPDKPIRFTKVLASIDPDPHDETHQALSREIMELGKSIAQYDNGQFHVVHAWELFGSHLLQSRTSPSEYALALKREENRVADVLHRFLAAYGLTEQNDEVHLLYDQLGPGHAIAELVRQEQIDLVVMGTIARAGMTGAFIGNTAEKILDRVECSVLALKPDTFVSPVTLPEN